MHIDANDQKRIAEAITVAETTTSGEILCVFTNERHRYVEWLVGLATVAAFLIPWISTALGFGPEAWASIVGIWRSEALAERQVIDIYAAGQALCFALALLLLWWSPLAQRFAPRSMRQHRVHDMAVRQFIAHNMHATAGRTGVLILVSARDHVVEVVADRGIYEKVSPDHWGEAAEVLLDGLRRDDPTGGFLSAIALAGGVLSGHFPPGSENPNEIDNHLVIL